MKESRSANGALHRWLASWYVFFVSLNGALYLPWKLEFEARNHITYKLTMFHLFTRESELDVSLVVKMACLQVDGAQYYLVMTQKTQSC